MDRAIYEPSDWGKEFHSRLEDEVLGAGAAGPGKTWVLIADPLHQVLVESARMHKDPRIAGFEERDPEWELIRKNAIRPGYSTGQALHLRRTYNMLTDTIKRARQLFPAVDPDVKWTTKPPVTFTFSSGYRVEFGHCQHLDDWEQYFSREFTHIAFDELVQFDEEQYNQIITRCRTADPVLKHLRKRRAMSNPLQRRKSSDNFHVSDPHWVRKRFVEPAPQGRTVITTKVRERGKLIKRTKLYLPATLYDNPDPDFVEQYEAELAHAPAHIKKALLYGDWYVTAGGYYDDAWDSSIHVCVPFRIPAHWPMFRSMDWGYKQRGCCHWWAVDPDGNMFCVKELIFRRKGATWVAEKIAEIERHMGLWGPFGSKITGPADTQLWEKRGETGKSKAEEMGDVGVGWVRADKRSRMTNAMRVFERLCDHDSRTTTPGLVFFDTCKMAIRTVPSIQTDPMNVEEPLDGGDDHEHDSVCYAVAYASHGVDSLPEVDDDEEYYSTDVVDRGQYGYGQH